MGTSSFPKLPGNPSSFWGSVYPKREGAAAAAAVKWDSRNFQIGRIIEEGSSQEATSFRWSSHFLPKYWSNWIWLSKVNPVLKYPHFAYKSPIPTLKENSFFNK